MNKPVSPKPVEKILLLEDDIDDRDLFEDALKDIAPGVKLVTAENGIEGLGLLKNRELPDLVFLDLNMPLKNGHECLEEIKNDKELQHLPVIVFSTSVQPEAADSVYNNGASLYLVKPDTFRMLKASIRKVLDDAHAFGSSRPSRDTFILRF